MKTQSQDPVPYVVSDKAAEDAIIASALEILERRNAPGTQLVSPKQVKDYLTMRLAAKDYEVFGVVFLTGQNTVISFDEVFRGTLTQTAVYPREVVKLALEKNAGAVIFTHNHPSGMPEPSSADVHLTKALKAALALVDVQVLDHIVVATSGTVSFAERGLL